MSYEKPSLTKVIAHAIRANSDALQFYTCAALLIGLYIVTTGAF